MSHLIFLHNILSHSQYKPDITYVTICSLLTGSREELTSIEKTYTEKRLNSIPEESTEELEELEQPCELVKRETNLKRDLEEPMESGSPFKRSRKEGMLSILVCHNGFQCS